MHTDHFTTLQRSLGPAASRRSLLAGLAGLAGLAAGAIASRPDDAEAKRKGRGKGKGKGKNTRKKRKSPSLPPVSPPPDVPVPLPQLRPDAECTVADDGLVSSTPDGRLAQTFTAIRSGELVQADLELVKPSASLGDFILQLAPVDGFGFPTNDVLATVTLPGAQVPDGFPSVATFTFPQPGRVTAGVQYALVLSRPEVGITGWRGRTDNGCGGRAFSSETRTGPFAGVGQSVDLVFTTVVRS